MQLPRAAVLASDDTRIRLSTCMSFRTNTPRVVDRAPKVLLNLRVRSNPQLVPVQHHRPCRDVSLRCRPLQAAAQFLRDGCEATQTPQQDLMLNACDLARWQCA